MPGEKRDPLAVIEEALRYGIDEVPVLEDGRFRRALTLLPLVREVVDAGIALKKAVYIGPSRNYRYYEGSTRRMEAALAALEKGTR